MKGYIDSGVEEGAELAAGGIAPTATAAATSCTPTLFAGVDDSMRIAREEIFGPVLVGRCPSTTTSRRWPAEPTTPSTAWPPASGPATSPTPTSSPRCSQAGNVYVNTWGGGDPAAPFGGYKASGIGREKGHINLDAYLETKTVWVQL